MDTHREKLPNIFYVYYFAVFMGTAIFNSFFSTFFTQAGMSSSQVGLLFGIAPLVGLVVQPIWGALSDRAKTKNRVHLVVIGGIMTSIAVFYCINHFLKTSPMLLTLLSGAMILFTCFQNALIPMQDTITLDYISKHGGYYGHARMSGTLGYAVMALAAGAILNVWPDSIFPIYFVTLCGIFAIASCLPKAQGYRKKGEKGSIFEVLKDRELLLVMMIVLVQYMTLAFGHTYLGPYMLSLGGNSTMIGLANTVQALTEIPLYTKWGRGLMKKIGIQRLLIIATVLGAVRWALTAVCKGPALLVIATGFEGPMLVPMIVGVVEYVNERVPAKLKATGQMTLTLFSVVLSRTIGNIGGGALVDVFNNLGYNGMSMVYALLVPISLIAAIGIGIPMLRMRKQQEANL